MDLEPCPVRCLYVLADCGGEFQASSKSEAARCGDRIRRPELGLLWAAVAHAAAAKDTLRGHLADSKTPPRLFNAPLDLDGAGGEGRIKIAPEDAKRHRISVPFLLLVASVCSCDQQSRRSRRSVEVAVTAHRSGGLPRNLYRYHYHGSDRQRTLLQT